VKEVNFFIHDSLHTAEHVMFELKTLWPHLSVGGAMVVDDVDASDGLALFLERQSARWLAGAHVHKQGRFAAVLKHSER
jgi:cephalosporin hydroxylase